jgi:hypothetical protein
MIEELWGHGYELSTGTLYPILHGLEQLHQPKNVTADSLHRI